MSPKFSFICLFAALFVNWRNAAASPAFSWTGTKPGVVLGDTSSGVLVADEMCLTDGIGSYANSESATITALYSGLLEVRGTFRTESTSYDYLTIQGMKYGGTTPPGSLSLTTGETFTWKSDSSITKEGFTICLLPSGMTSTPTRYPTNYPTSSLLGGTRYPTNYPTNYPTSYPTTNDCSNINLLFDPAQSLADLSSERVLGGLANHSVADYPDDAPRRVIFKCKPGHVLADDTSRDPYISYCIDDAAGKKWSHAPGACVPCAAGRAARDGGKTCDVCLAGTYQEEEGAAVCKLCDRGHRCGGGITKFVLQTPAEGKNLGGLGLQCTSDQRLQKESKNFTDLIGNGKSFMKNMHDEVEMCKTQCREDKLCTHTIVRSGTARPTSAPTINPTRAPTSFPSSAPTFAQACTTDQQNQCDPTFGTCSSTLTGLVTCGCNTNVMACIDQACSKCTSAPTQSPTNFPTSSPTAAPTWLGSDPTLYIYTSTTTCIGSTTPNCCVSATKIRIDSTVVSIKNFAFTLCHGVTEVDFTQASNLETIGSKAFFNMNGLGPSVDMSSATKLKQIKSNAFKKCGQLTSIKLASSITAIGNYAFTLTGIDQAVDVDFNGVDCDAATLNSIGSFDFACPTFAPTQAPSLAPSVPTAAPTTSAPSSTPTASPSTFVPTSTPTAAPTTSAPSSTPTASPSTFVPTAAPSSAPTTSRRRRLLLTNVPSSAPTQAPTGLPTSSPASSAPTGLPTSPPASSTSFVCEICRLASTEDWQNAMIDGDPDLADLAIQIFAGEYGASIVQTPCPPGEVQPERGSAACLPCPSGKFFNRTVSNDKALECDACASGRFSAVGQRTCEDCTAGKHAPLASSASCSKCAEGRFSFVGSASCWKCATSSGVVCGSGVLTLQPGTWYPFEADPIISENTNIYSCFNEISCVYSEEKDKMSCNTEKGYFGPLCGACDRDNENGHGYFTRSGRSCAKCWADALSWIAIAVMCSIVAVGIVYLVAIHTFAQRVGEYGDTIRKQLFSHIQMLGVLGIFKVKGTAVFNELVARPSEVVGGSITSLIPIKCALHSQIYGPFLTNLSLPPILIFFAALVVLPTAFLEKRKHQAREGKVAPRFRGVFGIPRKLAIAKCLRRPMTPSDVEEWQAVFHWSQRLSGVTVFILFTLYPSLVSSIASMFNCTSPIAGKVFLVADLTVECYVDTHLLFISFGVIGVFAYSLGIPIAIAMATAMATPIDCAREGANKCVCQRRGADEYVKHSMRERYAFLYNGYATDRSGVVVAWEALVMMRKLAVTLAGTLVRDPYLQILAALLILVVSCVVTAYVQPYETSSLNLLDTLGLFTLIVTQILSILYFYAESATRPFIDTQSLEAMVTVLLIALNLIVIVTFLVNVGLEQFSVRKRCRERRSFVLRVATAQETRAVLNGTDVATRCSWVHPASFIVSEAPELMGNGVWVWSDSSMPLAVSSFDPEMLVHIDGLHAIEPGESFRYCHKVTHEVSVKQAKVHDVGGRIWSPKRCTCKAAPGVVVDGIGNVARPPVGDGDAVAGINPLRHGGVVEDSSSDSESEPVEDALPPGWSAHEHAEYDGRLYYTNEHTKEVVWQRPTLPATPAPAGWTVHVHSDGNVYYANVSTGKTSWTLPSEAAHM